MYPENGVYYQLFVRSFADSDNDGIGDFNGITENLDYFVEMGIDSIWLMPIHPSPTYHGYDVLDYYAVNPEYGTMEDFENLLEESEKLGINIIIDFVINHTSRQHPWFTAWANGDSAYAGFYRKILSSDSRYEDNPGLWHALGEGYYYAGFFGSSMPDLNWSNPNVQNEMVNIGKYWLEKGVDGFRLDAALHLEDYGEVLPGTVPIDSTLTKLEWFEYQLEAEYPDVYIVGEVWSSFSEFSLFYQSMDSALNFETGGNILSVINRGYSPDYVSGLLSDYETIHSYGEDKLDAPFLYNHDQDRIASILNGNIPKLKLAAEMLLTLEGNPYIYYGEELGMFGVKTYGPDIWDETRRLPFLFDNEYQTSWIEDTYNMNVVSVSEQLADPNSLLNTYKTLLNVRQNSLALKYGMLLECPYSDNALQGYYRDFYYDEVTNQRVLVLHNVTEGDYVLGDIVGTVIYYSGGVDNYDGTIEARSTVIIEVPYEN
jgi:glycosidase